MVVFGVGPGLKVASQVQFNPQRARIPIPSPTKMLVSIRTDLRVSRTAVTGSQFAALFELLGKEGVSRQISGHNIDRLLEIAEDRRFANSPAVYASIADGDMVAKIANEQNPGRSFRLPTIEELHQIFEELGDQLGGIINYRICTKTEIRDRGTFFVLKVLPGRGFSSRWNRCDYIATTILPDSRYSHTVVLLVEDIVENK